MSLIISTTTVLKRFGIIEAFPDFTRLIIDLNNRKLWRTNHPLPLLYKEESISLPLIFIGYMNPNISGELFPSL